jgi:hypothetical protein
MTMQHPIHPDPERLAALAGGDQGATADGALVAHADACAQCNEVVRELRLLRTVLSELPDLAPSRPLRLVPPVAAEPGPGGRFGWLRRLAAPVMAAGAGLALVGAVGLGSVALSGMASSAGAIFQNVGSNLTTGEGSERGEDAPDAMSQEPAAVASGEEAPTDGGQADEEATNDRALIPTVDLGSPAPWLVLFGTGALLLLTGLAIRFAVQPRAG